VGKLDRIVKRVLTNYYMKTYGWSEKHTKEFIEATFDLWRETDILPDVMEAIKGVAKAIFEDIEKRMGELDPVMEIWAITEKDWQDLKKRFGVEDE